MLQRVQCHLNTEIMQVNYLVHLLQEAILATITAWVCWNYSGSGYTLSLQIQMAGVSRMLCEKC